MILDNNEALECVGGAGLTASLVNAISGLLKTVYGIGKDLGATIKRAFGGC